MGSWAGGSVSLMQNERLRFHREAGRRLSFVMQTENMFIFCFALKGSWAGGSASFMQSERLKVIVYLLFCTGSWAGGSVSLMQNERVRFHWEAGPEAQLPRCKLRITLSLVLH